ncbi:unnamed protein product [Dimorphilus gyrociliatus]|nr:unnamed protein product [Dimorphilus gyrociliatus]
MSDSVNRFSLLPRSARALSVDTASLMLTAKQLKRLDTIYEKKLKHDHDNDSGNESAGEIDSPEAVYITPKTREKISSLAPSSVELVIPENVMPRRGSLQDIKILAENKPKKGLSRIESLPCITALQTKNEKVELPNRTINKRTGLLSSDEVLKKIGPEVINYNKRRAGDAEIIKSFLSFPAEKAISKTANNLETSVQNVQPKVSNVEQENMIKTTDTKTKEQKLFAPPKKNETFGKFLKRRLSGGSSQDNIIAPTSH